MEKNYPVCSYNDKLEIEMLLIDEDSGSILGKFLEYLVFPKTAIPCAMVNALALCVFKQRQNGQRIKYRHQI